MNQIADILTAATPIVNAIVGGVVIVMSARLKRIEARLEALGGHVHSNHCEKPRLPVLLGPLALLLFCGCVQTSFKHGESTMTRTAVFTRVTVPKLEISTNGTMKASVDSDARTELLEALLRSLVSAAK